MKKTGIWLDKNKAIIIYIDDDSEKIFTVPSNIEHFHIHGGSGTRFKGGPQDVIQDSKYLEREKHQLKKFFQNILKKTSNSNSIVLFGPAEVKDKFKKLLERTYPSYHKQLVGVLTTDSMTDNQLKAWVRNYFK